MAPSLHERRQLRELLPGLQLRARIASDQHFKVSLRGEVVALRNTQLALRGVQIRTCFRYVHVGDAAEGVSHFDKL
jgi:hypothetical protein